jgi:hypothetical protein
MTGVERAGVTIGGNMCLPLKPYKVEREWKHAGLSCAVVLAQEVGHRCGYVRVPPTHPMYQKGYDVPNAEVHGRLTFAEIEPCTEHEDGQGWWFGFDCAHLGDASCDLSATPVTPEGIWRLEIEREMIAKYPLTPQHYWTEAEVVAETEHLAEQLASVSAEFAAEVEATGR